MINERRIADRRHVKRITPDRRLAERRARDRWHATESLVASFEIGCTRHIGVLRNISSGGCMLEATMSVSIPHDDSPVAPLPGEGMIELTIASRAVRVRASIARQGKHSLGLRFVNPVADSLLAAVVEACKAYSIQYRDGRICFVGDLSSIAATLHLLKYIKVGATVDLSRARGDQARAAASMTLLRERGVQLSGCNRYLNVAIAMAGQRICTGCYSDCHHSRHYNGPDSKATVSA